MDRNSPPPLSPRPPPSTREYVLSLLKKVVHEIQSTDRQLTDLVIPQDIYELCRRYVEELPFTERYDNQKVFEILQQDSKELYAGEIEVNKMKNGLKSLLRYPLNLLVAPNRPELKIIKASTAFFMFQVKKNLKDAHSFLSLMGYDQVRNSTDLSLSKSFSIDRVYTLVLDIVILHEELEIISFLISQAMSSDVKIEFYHYFIARRWGPSNKWDCLDFILKGEAARFASSSLQHSPYPSSGYQHQTTAWGQDHREDSTGQNYYNTTRSSSDYRGYRDQRYDNNDYNGVLQRYADTGYHTSLYHEDEHRKDHMESHNYKYPSNYYGNESDQYHRNQHDRDQYHRDQYDRDQYHQYQYHQYQSQYQDDLYSRDQHYYNHGDGHSDDKDERRYQQEDRDPSKIREVYCDGGQSVDDRTSPSYNDTIISTGPLDSVGGNMPAPIFNAGEMRRMFQSSTPRKELSKADDQSRSLGHTSSKGDSFDKPPHGINNSRRSSSTPSFASETSYTNNMYSKFDGPVFSPSESVKFTIEETERNEEETSSSSPPHYNQDGRSIKPRKNNAPSVAAGSTNLPKTWYGTNADREILKQMSKDDSVLVMADGHKGGAYNYWTCTFCSNVNYGGNSCEACNQERASLHSY